MVRIAINRFDMARLHHNSVIYNIGRRGSGKSHLMKHIIYQLRNDIDYAIGFAGSLSAENDMKSGGICPANIYAGFDIDILQGVVDLCKYWKAAKIERNVLIVCDDLMFDKKIMKNELFRLICMNGRHHNITFINAIQYVMDMGADLRSQVDFVFAFYDPNEGTREKLRREFFGVFPNMKAFTKVTDKCIAKQYECLVLDAKGVDGRQTSATDTVHWFKAPEAVPVFRVGRSSIWKLHKRYRISADERLRRAKAAVEKSQGRLKPLKKTKGGTAADGGGGTAVVVAPAATPTTTTTTSARKNEPPEIDKMGVVASSASGGSGGTKNRSVTLNVGKPSGAGAAVRPVFGGARKQQAPVFQKMRPPLTAAVSVMPPMQPR